MAVGWDVDDGVGVVAHEVHEVEGGEVAGGVVQEHVFRAGVGAVDAAIVGAGVPLVDGGVVLDAGVGAGPGGSADARPEIAGGEGLGGLAVDAADEVPGLALLDGLDEAVGHAHGVVGVLAGDGDVGFALPVGVVDGEVEGLVALLGEAEGAGDKAVGHAGGAGFLDGLLVGFFRSGLLGFGGFLLGVPGGHDGVDVLAAHDGAGDQGGDLLLLDHFPVDELLDVGVVDVDDDHLGGAAGGAARLDGTCGAVAYLEEGEEAARFAAAGEALVLAAQGGEVGACAGAVLEDAGLAHPEVHDAAGVDEVVVDGLDEARVGLRSLIGGGGLLSSPVVSST